MRKRFSISLAIIYIIILFSVFITLYPFVYIMIQSICDFNGITQMRSRIFYFPSHVSFSAYKIILRSENIYRSLVNSVVYTLTGTLLSIIVTVMMAYPLSKKDLFGRKVFMLYVTFTLLFGVSMIPLYLVVHNLGIRNTMWAVILPFVLSPWNLILTRTFFENIPGSIQESAHIDGCNDIRVLFSIIIPMSMPIIATISLYYAVWYWNSYFWPMIFLDSRKMFPIQVLLREILIQGTMANEMSAGDELLMSESIKGATTMVATIPIILVYPFLQKYFVKGILVGAIKG